MRTANEASKQASKQTARGAVAQRLSHSGTSAAALAESSSLTCSCASSSRRVATFSFSQRRTCAAPRPVGAYEPTGLCARASTRKPTAPASPGRHRRTATQRETHTGGCARTRAHSHPSIAVFKPNLLLCPLERLDRFIQLSLQVRHLHAQIQAQSAMSCMRNLLACTSSAAMPDATSAALCPPPCGCAHCPGRCFTASRSAGRGHDSAGEAVSAPRGLMCPPAAVAGGDGGEPSSRESPSRS